MQSIISLTVAATILEQMGGNRFIRMTGANGFVGSVDTLKFFIPRSNGVRIVQITLEPSDTYTMRFFKVYGHNVTEIRKVEDVYCDQLQEVFTSVTGLYTHL